MKKFGTVSYNLYGNFTNYGSALQTWALHQAINKLGKKRWEAVLVDYCPDILADKDPLNPFKNMWDRDEESLRMCKLSMPAIRENYKKFNDFYHSRFKRTVRSYTSENFEEILQDEQLGGFVCGSDTIFCTDEFGFDDGYYANYDCMKGHSVAYAASFGDSHFTDEMYLTLNNRLGNFLALGLRENLMLSYVKEHTVVPVQKVIDPTLLLASEDYDKLATKRLEEKPYLLLYTRRYNPIMEDYARKKAKENGWKIVEISLRATNTEKGHRLFYDAGVEEFLSLVKYSEFVVTNSFHGMIFSVQYKRDFSVFSREQCDNKIMELLQLFGLTERMMISGEELVTPICYETVHDKIRVTRHDSLKFLENELELLIEE